MAREYTISAFQPHQEVHLYSTTPFEGKLQPSHGSRVRREPLQPDDISLSSAQPPETDFTLTEGGSKRKVSSIFPWKKPTTKIEKRVHHYDMSGLMTDVILNGRNIEFVYHGDVSNIRLNASGNARYEAYKSCLDPSFRDELPPRYEDSVPR